MLPNKNNNTTCTLLINFNFFRSINSYVYVFQWPDGLAYYIRLVFFMTIYFIEIKKSMVPACLCSIYSEGNKFWHPWMFSHWMLYSKQVLQYLSLVVTKCVKLLQIWLCHCDLTVMSLILPHNVRFKLPHCKHVVTH